MSAPLPPRRREPAAYRPLGDLDLALGPGSLHALRLQPPTNGLGRDREVAVVTIDPSVSSLLPHHSPVPISPIPIPIRVLFCQGQLTRGSRRGSRRGRDLRDAGGFPRKRHFRGRRRLWWFGGGGFRVGLPVVMFFEGLAERCSDLREAELASAGTSGSREVSGDHLRGLDSTADSRDEPCSCFMLSRKRRVSSGDGWNFCPGSLLMY